MIDRGSRRNGTPAAAAAGVAGRGWRHGNWRRAIACVVMFALLPGCYTYRPIVGTRPAPGIHVDLRISDEGRIALRDRIGSDIARIEGRLAYTSDTAYVLRVSGVHDLHGVQRRWAGEEVSIRREYVAVAQERKIDRVRSVALGAGLVAMIVVLFATDLLGFGGDADDERPIEPEPT